MDIATSPRQDERDYYTFSGISVFSKRAFSLLPDRDVFSMVEVFRSVLHKHGVIKGYPCDMTWYNINSCKTFWLLNQDILNRTVTFQGIDVTIPRYIDPSSRVKTKDLEGFVSVGARCEVAEGVKLENTVVFDDSHLSQGTFSECLVSDVFCVHMRE